MESYGSLQKTREQSIGNLGKQGRSGPESSMQREGKNQVMEEVVRDSSDHFQETNPGPSPPHSSDDPDQSLGEHSEGSDDSSKSAKSVDEVEDTLSYLAKHGGVRHLNTLLAAAVPPGSEIPDTCNIHEWSFKDIMRMPSA